MENRPDHAFFTVIHLSHLNNIFSVFSLLSSSLFVQNYCSTLAYAVMDPVCDPCKVLPEYGSVVSLVNRVNLAQGLITAKTFT